MAEKNLTKKCYDGNLRIGEEFDILGPIDDEGIKWGLSVGGDNGKGWRSVKVSAIPKAQVKANYWLSWNGERFAKGRDMKLLRDGRPELEEKIIASMGQLD